MAVVQWDEKTFKLFVRCSPTDNFQGDDVLSGLVENAETLVDDYKAFQKKLSGLLDECHEWNMKNDIGYKEKYLRTKK